MAAAVGMMNGSSSLSHQFKKHQTLKTNTKTKKKSMKICCSSWTNTAAAVGMMNGSSSLCHQFKKHQTLKTDTNTNTKTKKKSMKICCSSWTTNTVADPYSTLRIQPDASKSEVRKAFRKLALQYHPDVCRGSDCGVQFHLINEAYDIVMNSLREEPPTTETFETYYDPDYDMWEEWMGWEGAWIRDYTSHINPYI